MRERELPCLWAIEGQVHGGRGAVAYKLTPYNAGAIFEREFVYVIPNPLLALLNRFELRRRVEVETVEAVRRLKNALEERSKGELLAQQRRS